MSNGKKSLAIVVTDSDSIEAWASDDNGNRPYLVRGDAVEKAFERMVDSGRYDVDFVDLGSVWSASVTEK